MLPHTAHTQLIWVTGEGTDFGKTTLAAALVRVLNRAGLPTVGMKPYAVARLRDLVDDMLTRGASAPVMPMPLDGLALASSSPLTPTDRVDLVSPVRLVTHPGWLDAVTLQIGSRCLGQTRHYRFKALDEWSADADIRRLAAAGWAIDSAERRDSMDTLDLPQWGEAAVQQAHEALLQLGARCIVCEGASRFSPAWRGSPTVDHLLHVAAGRITWIPDIQMVVGDRHRPRLEPVHTLLRGLPRQPATRVARWPLAPHAERASVAETVVEALLQPGAPGPGRDRQRG